MAPKRLSTDDLLRLQKKAKTLATEPPLPPYSFDAESSTSRLQREAVEEFKNFAEFTESVDLARSQAFIEGFYACRNWLGHVSRQYDLSRICFSVIPPRHRYLPNHYLKTAEEVLVEKLEDDAAVALFADPEEETWAQADVVPVVLNSFEEEEDEREKSPVDFSDKTEDED